MGRKKKVVRLDETIYHKLKDNIISGVFLPGERLYEEELAKSMFVSRTPVRNALQRLRDEFFLEPVPGGTGLQVYKSKEEDIMSIINIRIQLEKLAIVNLIENSIEESFNELLVPLENMYHAIKEDDFDNIIKADDLFHKIIFEMSGDRWLSSMGITINEYFSFYRRSHLTERYHSWEESYRQHRELYSFIRRGNIKEASNLIEYHINYYKWPTSYDIVEDAPSPVKSL